MHRFARSAGVGLLAAAFIVAGCSGSSGGSPAAGSSSGPAAGASVAPDASTGEGGATASCKQLTSAQVQPLLSDPIKNVTVSPFLTGQQCRFDTGDTSESLDVYVLGGSDGQAAYTEDVNGFASPAPLPGIGDKAMWDSNNESSSFAALKGDVYCSVSVSAEDIPGVGALMDAANNTLRIGDANYLVIANALATLCNRIYGSGNTTVDLSGLSAPPSAAP